MIVAESSLSRDRLWEGAACMREAVVAEGGAKCGEDVVVPGPAYRRSSGGPRPHLSDVGNRFGLFRTRG